MDGHTIDHAGDVMGEVRHMIERVSVEPGCVLEFTFGVFSFSPVTQCFFPRRMPLANDPQKIALNAHPWVENGRMSRAMGSCVQEATGAAIGVKQKKRVV